MNSELVLIRHSRAGGYYHRNFAWQGRADVARGGSGLTKDLGLDHVEELFREYAASGAFIKLPPTNYPWAMEMQVLDPDGHILRFGSEPQENKPYSEWMR